MAKKPKKDEGETEGEASGEGGGKLGFLKNKKVKNVTMMPMMMVAGDHANNDMAGDEPDSHKSLLKKAGFSVKTYIHGLGENAAVRKLFVAKADEAWKALESSQKDGKGQKHK